MFVHDLIGLKSAILATIAILTVITNGVVIAVITRYPELRDDRITIFIFALAISHLSSGVTFMPLSAFMCLPGTPRDTTMSMFLHKVLFFIMTVLVGTNWCAMACLTASKTIIVLRPLRYSELLTTTRCHAVLVGSWVICVLHAAISTTFSGEVSWNADMCSYRLPIDRHYSATFAAIVLVAAVSMFTLLVYSSVRIFIVVVRAHSQIAALDQSIGGPTTLRGTGNVTLLCIRSARNVFIICVTCIILAGPMVLFSTLRNFGNSYVTSWWFGFIALASFNTISCVTSLQCLLLFRSIRQKTVRMFKDMFDCLAGRF